MSWLKRLFGGGARQRKVEQGKAAKRRGDLDRAVELFVAGGAVDEAARTLLLRADAAKDPQLRLSFCDEAARLAADPDLRLKARRRRARLKYDLLRDQPGALPSELLAAGRALERVEAFEDAADAYQRAGDHEGEVRALTSGGAIDRLEERLRESNRSAREEREHELAQKRIEDLDATGERAAALAEADRFLANHEDASISARARRIRARLLRPPLCELDVSGVPRLLALGDRVTIGRAESTINVAAPGISRQHLALYRAGHDLFAEDLATKNGTTLASARLAAPLPLGESQVVLKLAGEIAVKLRRRRPQASADGRDGVEIDVAGVSVYAPLGPVDLGAAKVFAEDRHGGVVVLVPAPGEAPSIGDYQVVRAIELCVGDSIRACKGGPVLVTVPKQSGAAEGLS